MIFAIRKVLTYSAQTDYRAGSSADTLHQSGTYRLIQVGVDQLGIRNGISLLDNNVPKKIPDVISATLPVEVRIDATSFGRGI